MISFATEQGTGAGDTAFVIFNSGAQLPATQKIGIIASAIPGLGKVALWINGERVGTGTSAARTLGNAGWAEGTAGSFAQAANGTSHSGADLTAPANFTVIEPWSVYVGQVPRQFPR